MFPVSEDKSDEERAELNAMLDERLQQLDAGDTIDGPAYRPRSEPGCEVSISGRARLEIERNEQWWRANRQVAPTMFLEELIAAIEQASIIPSWARRIETLLEPGVRYVILPRTQRNLYYLDRRPGRLLGGVGWSPSTRAEAVGFLASR